MPFVQTVACSDIGRKLSHQSCESTRGYSFQTEFLITANLSQPLEHRLDPTDIGELDALSGVFREHTLRFIDISKRKLANVATQASGRHPAISNSMHLSTRDAGD